MRIRILLVSLGVLQSAIAQTALNRKFQQDVRPFVNKYCVGCHSGASPAAQFDLKAYTTLDQVTHDFSRWSLVLDKLAAKQMPPPPIPAPPEANRRRVLDWIQSVRTEQIKKTAGDPGLVLPRRLSNAEYGYAIRDLTGQDLKPTREFPIDPANTAGFDNSGESLTMSPALLAKYLQAAREVADHAVLTPSGIEFAPYPMLVETDREKYYVQRIVDFYLQQPTDFADYFQAAWRFEHRAVLGKPAATLASVGAESKVSAKYLPMVWDILHESDAVGPIAKLQAMWKALPAPGGQFDAVRMQCVAMRDFVVRIRKHTAMQFSAPIVRGLPAGSQPLLAWKNREFAAHRRESDPKDLLNDTDPPPPAPVVPRRPGLHEETGPYWAGVSAKARLGDTDLIVPAAERARYEAAFSRFASVFPDAFYISERGRYFPENTLDKGRFLSAGYHNTGGYFRDDTPLIELILDDKGHAELERLWNEFDFVGAQTEHTWVQYFDNQSGEVRNRDPEAGTPRPSNHAITDEAVIFQLRDEYLAKAAALSTNSPIAPKAIRTHFEDVNATLRALEKQHAEAEPKHLEAVAAFAEHAYRRPLAQSERDDLLAYYRELRGKKMSHEDAIRNAIVSILVSPDFFYRIDILDPGMGPRTSASKASGSGKVLPNSSYALASRLSFFLWATIPDDELLRHAASGDLQKHDVLIAQARRMLADPRSRALATEFGGNWLDFRHFESNNSVDRERFPQFNNDLREAMYQEPIRFLEDMFRKDSSVLDALYGRYTFVNPALAKHYGIEGVTGTPDTWVRVDDADTYGRGGVLPMAVFLTQTSPGLRTSVVKRGYWVVHRVIGETIPPPPPVVPELPHDEALTNLPLRDLLAAHRANPVCASCHARFDGAGLAFEGYGPVGEARTKDLAGRPIDASAIFPGGTQGAGLDGVKAYIRDHRQSEYVANLSRKLLAYALNRSLQLSDEALVDRAETKLRESGYRFSALVETIITSPQFLNVRAPAARESVEVESRR